LPTIISIFDLILIARRPPSGVRRPATPVEFCDRRGVGSRRADAELMSIVAPSSARLELVRVIVEDDPVNVDWVLIPTLFKDLGIFFRKYFEVQIYLTLESGWRDLRC
jgi:hypothetical protein